MSAPVERADSRRKRLRLIDAARIAIAERGLDVAAADIAARAEVGIGTLYRRFGSKEALIEAVVRELLDDLTVSIKEAMAADPAEGLELLLVKMAEGQVANRAVTELITNASSFDPESLREHIESVRAAFEELTERAQRAGTIRTDVTWRDVVIMAHSVVTPNCLLGIEVNDHQWQRNYAVLMDGLRPGGSRTLPGSPPQDSPTSGFGSGPPAG
jgi:AcrR family transcriptional regulator